MKRTNEFIADDAIPAFMDELNRVVLHGEQLEAPTEFTPPPLLLVLGAPRSGTTVLLQWLSRIGLACPTNIAARFYQTPYFAGMLQRLLMDQDLNYRNELSIPQADEFSSDYGKTQGLLSPHEFSFFFRRYFPVTVGEKLTAEQCAQADATGFLHGAGLFGHALGLPVAMKGLLIQYNLDLLRDASHVLFLHTHRSEADNVCSLMRHRQWVADDLDEWISVRPPQYAWLKDLSPVEQVAGQVHFTNQELRNQLRSLPGERVLDIDHETFCKNPHTLFELLRERITKLGFPDLGQYTGPPAFEQTQYDTDSVEYQSAMAAIERVRTLADSQT